MDTDQQHGHSGLNTNTTGRRSAGGSLWSGFKQMFHAKNAPEYPPRGQQPPQPPQRPTKRLEHSSFSYSCLGNSNSRQRSEDDIYGNQTPTSLSRNISYSHESVFQMDPPNNPTQVTWQVIKSVTCNINLNVPIFSPSQRVLQN